MTIERICEIIRNMDDEMFNKIMQADYDYWELDKRTSRNGYKRLVYNLAKFGLTPDDYWAWCSL